MPIILRPVFFMTLLGMIAPAAADDKLDENLEAMSTVNCINTSRIRNTRIVDDSTILFYMSGGKAYINRLPRRCSGLRMAGGFGYETSTRQLCRVDTITVLRTGGGGMGAACGLGVFKPITREEIGLLGKEPEPEPEDSGAQPELQAPEGGPADKGDDETE